MRLTTATVVRVKVGRTKRSIDASAECANVDNHIDSTHGPHQDRRSSGVHGRFVGGVVVDVVVIDGAFVLKRCERIGLANRHAAQTLKHVSINWPISTAPAPASVL